MFKMILAAVVAIGFSSVVFANDAKPAAGAPTTTETTTTTTEEHGKMDAGAHDAKGKKMAKKENKMKKEENTTTESH